MADESPDISRYWKTVVDTVQDALMIVSPEGRILSVNRAAEGITGYKSEELVGKPCTVLDCTGCTLYGRGPGPDWCKLFEDEKVVAKRCHISNKGGEKVTVVKQATVLRDDDGQIIGAVEALADISEMIKKEREIISLRRSLAEEEGFHGIIGHAPVMQRLYELIENTARSEAPVLIHGESGTGKELVARAIHELGIRSQKPFIKVNCAALNQNLLETELFGHVKGAFTGADRARVGRFEAAHTGDIFLDEIGDVPLPTQVKLLRVLEEKEIERVGDHRPIKVDVRFVTATHRDLSELIKKGRFREDLFYRINVVPIQVPSLKERQEDIPLLAQTFVDRLRTRTGKPLQGISKGAMDRLMEHPWPGNVRELKNAMEYAFVLCHEGVIRRVHLPENIGGLPAGRNEACRVPQPPSSKEPPAAGGREELLDALRRTQGNQTQAAKLLGVSRMTVWKRMKKFGVDPHRDL